MFRLSKKQDIESKARLDIPNTIIGHGITVEAVRLSGKESVRIDGNFFGDIELDGSLILGESGVIEGRTRAIYIVIAGTVRGDIICDGVLHIASTAVVNGDITASKLIVDEGGQLNGRSQVGESNILEIVQNQPMFAEVESEEKRIESRSYLDRANEIIAESENAKV